MTIRLPCYGIRITLHPNGGGTISSDLAPRYNGGRLSAEDANLVSAVDGLESLILAHACAGVNVEDFAYIEGIETAVDAIENNSNSRQRLQRV